MNVMDLLSLKLIQYIHESVGLASLYKSNEVHPVHVIYVSLLDSNSLLKHIFENNVFKDLTFHIKKAVESMPTIDKLNQDPQLSNTLVLTLNECKDILNIFNDKFISIEHVFLSKNILENPYVKKWMRNNNFTKDTIISKIQNNRGGKSLNNKTSDQMLNSLKTLCKDITEMAQNNQLDPVIGREDEIRRIKQVLSRRTKNNPVLIGPPGVGKTAVVEGLAIDIIKENVPHDLIGAKIYSLDLASLVAGCSIHGMLEDRIKSIISEIENSNGKYILFIDEIHALMSVGDYQGGVGAANILKPPLARGTIKCIGATTIDEYKRYIEKDAALERRFQPILIEEPTVNEAINILINIIPRYENYHGVSIEKSAAVSAVKLTHKYLPDRRLPDKAIDVIDEAASIVKTQMGSIPQIIENKKKEIVDIQLMISTEKLLKTKDTEKINALEQEAKLHEEQLLELEKQWKNESAIIENINRLSKQLTNLEYEAELAQSKYDYNRLAKLKHGDIPELKAFIADEKNRLLNLKNKMLHDTVDDMLIAKIVSKWSGTPLEKMIESDTTFIANIEPFLMSRIAGQEHAVKYVCNTIKKIFSGLHDPNKPIVLMFIGPTGVGKTELAKSLTKFLFGSEKKMLRLDMSEFMEKHSVSKIIGSPPGYIGYDSTSYFSETLRSNPYSVVLLDEIEKAHHDVLNIFLQMFSDGRITDSKGRTVDVSNSIFIMTSNIGSHDIIDAIQNNNESNLENICKDLLLKFMTPEFINRIDRVIPFRPLDLDNVRKIVNMYMIEIIKRTKTRGVNLSLDDDVIDYIAKHSYSNTLGARPVQRWINDNIVNIIADVLLDNTRNINDINISVSENQNTLIIN